MEDFNSYAYMDGVRQVVVTRPEVEERVVEIIADATEDALIADEKARTPGEEDYNFVPGTFKTCDGSLSPLVVRENHEYGSEGNGDNYTLHASGRLSEMLNEKYIPCLVVDVEIRVPRMPIGNGDSTRRRAVAAYQDDAIREAVLTRLAAAAIPELACAE